ncbi:hypothetical protein WCLP8_1140002 [uncultured Gammaproteobacteria bacterium]
MTGKSLILQITVSEHLEPALTRRQCHLNMKDPAPYPGPIPTQQLPGQRLPRDWQSVNGVA